MPKVSAAHREARRQQILAAARACFARRGFHQTTMQDICRTSELSAGAVYRYFPSKDDIIEALCDDHTGDMAALFAELTARDSWWDMLGYLEEDIRPLLDGGNPYKDIALDVEVWGEALRNPRAGAVVRHTLAMQRELVARIVRHAAARGDLPPDTDGDAVARAAVAVLSGLMLQHALEPEADLAPALAVARAMLAALGGSGQASSEMPSVSLNSGTPAKEAV